MVTSIVRNSGWPHLIALLMIIVVTGCSTPVKPPEPVEGEYALVIRIHGLECCEGVLRVALYNGADYWLNDQGMVRGQAAPVLANEQTVEFAGLPADDYAVAVYQDINANMRLDRFLGMVPREPYGFSGNPAGVGRPSFDAAKVTLTESMKIIIEIQPSPL